MKKLITLLTIFSILACFCLALVPVQAEQEPLWSYTTDNDVNSVAISSDGNYIAAGGWDNNVYIIDKQGKKIGSYETGGGVWSVAISSDGKYIAAGSNYPDGTVYIIDKQGKKIGSYKTGGDVKSVAITPDGNYIAAGSGDNNVYILDKQGKKIGSFKTGGGVVSVAISSDGKYIAAGGLDHKVYIIDKQGKKIGSFKTEGFVYSVAISSDGNYIAAGYSTTVYIIDKQGKKIGSFKTRSNSVAISSDGNYIAAGSRDNNVYIIDKQGKKIGSFKTGDRVYSVAISSDGNYIAAGGLDHKVYIIDKQGKKIGSFKTEGFVYSVAISSDGNYIAAGGRDDNVYLFAKGTTNTGTAKVYVNNEDDDNLDVKLWIGEEYKGVKNVPSGSSNYPFGDYELSPGDYKFEIKWNDPDHDRECTHLIYAVYINAGESKTVTLTAEKHLPSTGTATVYVNNEDDDNQDIYLWIDAESKGVKNVPSGSSNYHFGDYELSPGDHKFEIEWNDPDTYEWYEDETTATISVGEPTTVTLTVEKHVTVKAVANIINYDDDELEIDLYMEDEYITTKNIPHWGQQVEYITVLPGTYTFKIRWEDPDTWKKYEIENTVTFEPGDIGGRKVNLRVPKHQATTAEVYVMNKYSDTLEIDLEIDGNFEDRKEISPSSSMRFYGSYEVSPDSPIFEMSWDDPDTGEACSVNKEETFEEEEVKQIKLIAEKHGPALEVDVKPYGCVLEEGDTKFIDITIKNTGDTTAESVSVIIESKNTVTAIIGGSKTTDIGDIKPGETWTKTFAVPYIEAKKEGETTIEVKVRSDNAGDVSKEIQVRVVKPGTIATELSSRGESQPKRPSSAVIKDVLGSTNEFSVMYEAIEEEISDSFSKDGVDAALTVQSSGKAGKAVEGKKVTITLILANKNLKPIGVSAEIVPSESFTYKEDENTVTKQRIKQAPEGGTITEFYSGDRNTASQIQTFLSRRIDDCLETLVEWTWHTLQDPVVLREEGSALILEPYQVLIYTAEITPEQTGCLDISGEIYYTKEPIVTSTTVDEYKHFALKSEVVKLDPDKTEHVTLKKSITVEEKKKCYLGGLICP